MKETKINGSWQKKSRSPWNRVHRLVGSAHARPAGRHGAVEIERLRYLAEQHRLVNDQLHGCGR